MEVLNTYTLLGLSHLHRQILKKEFDIEEIKEAAFRLGSWNAPGPGDIPAMLFQKCWVTMGQTVIEATLSFLRIGYILKELNNTFITLVPKNLNSEEVCEYRPISLCNVAYKIAAKVLANRLKLIIDDLITPHQNAFVKGRSITDNIILTHELLHTIKKKKREDFVSLHLRWI